MRNVDSDLDRYKSAVLPIEDNMLSSALEEGEISREDLQLIDDFAGLPKSRQKIVLGMVRRGLRQKILSVPE